MCTPRRDESIGIQAPEANTDSSGTCSSIPSQQTYHHTDPIPFKLSEGSYRDVEHLGGGAHPTITNRISWLISIPTLEPQFQVQPGKPSGDERADYMERTLNNVENQSDSCLGSTWSMRPAHASGNLAISAIYIPHTSA